MSKSSHHVSAGDSKQFLVRVETIAVLDRKHAAQSGRFHHAEKKTTQREGQQVIEVRHMDSRKPEWRHALWHLAKQFHTETAKIHTRSSDNAGDDDEQGHRFILEKSLA